MHRCRGCRLYLVRLAVIALMMTSCHPKKSRDDVTGDSSRDEYDDYYDDDLPQSDDAVKTSDEDEDADAVEDADAKSFEDDDDYYYVDGDDEDDDYDDGNDGKVRKRQESRMYYPEPDYYPQQQYHEPKYYYKPTYKKKKKKKKVYVPVFVPEKEKKKMKILSVDKGFHVAGGTQLFGKYKSLKKCMKACAVTPSCLSGDFNPWLHKCYQHTNITACNTAKSHPQFIHFSKVPCTVVDAPTGRVTLGANMANGIEQKGIDTLQQCIKKCAAAGLGIPATATTPQSFHNQGCFAIDYDFATHRCYFFAVNYLLDANNVAVFLHCIIAPGVPQPSSLGLRPNPTVVHITLCTLILLLSLSAD